MAQRELNESAIRAYSRYQGELIDTIDEYSSALDKPLHGDMRRGLFLTYLSLLGGGDKNRNLGSDDYLLVMGSMGGLIDAASTGPVHPLPPESAADCRRNVYVAVYNSTVLVGRPREHAREWLKAVEDTVREGVTVVASERDSLGDIAYAVPLEDRHRIEKKALEAIGGPRRGDVPHLK